MRWDTVSKRLERMVAEEHCIGCDGLFHGIPDDKGKDYCPYCNTYQLLCNLCTIQPDCGSCPYEESL